MSGVNPSFETIARYVDQPKGWFKSLSALDQHDALAQMVSALAEEGQGVVYEGGRRLLSSWMVDTSFSGEGVEGFFTDLQKTSFDISEETLAPVADRWDTLAMFEKQNVLNKMAATFARDFNLKETPKIILGRVAPSGRQPGVLYVDPAKYRNQLETGAGAAQFILPSLIDAYFTGEVSGFESEERRAFRQMMGVLTENPQGQFKKNNARPAMQIVDISSRFQHVLSQYLYFSLGRENHTAAMESIKQLTLKGEYFAFAQTFDPVKWKRGIFLASKVNHGGISALSGLSAEDFKKVDPFILKGIYGMFKADPKIQELDLDYFVERALPTFIEAFENQTIDREIAVQSVREIKSLPSYKTAQKYWDRLSSDEISDCAQDIVNKFCERYHILPYTVEFTPIYQGFDGGEGVVCASSLEEDTRTIKLSSVPHMMPHSAEELIEIVQNTIPSMLLSEYSQMSLPVEATNSHVWHVHLAKMIYGEEEVRDDLALSAYKHYTAHIHNALEGELPNKVPDSLMKLRQSLNIETPQNSAHNIVPASTRPNEDMYVQRKLRQHAVQWLNQLQSQDYASLSEGQKREAMHFVAGLVPEQASSGEAYNAQTKLFKAANDLDRDFAQYQIRQNRDVLEYFTKDPAVQIYLQSWANMSETERLNSLQDVNAHLSAIRGVSPRPVTLYSLEKTEKGTIRYGQFAEGEVQINCHKVAGWDDAATVFSTLAHEQLHAWQNDKVVSLMQGEIEKDDPLYKQVMRYKLYWDSETMGDHTSYEHYRLHPIEVPAWQLTEQVFATLQKGQGSYTQRLNQIESDYNQSVGKPLNRLPKVAATRPVQNPWKRDHSKGLR